MKKVLFSNVCEIKSKLRLVEVRLVEYAYRDLEKWTHDS